MRLVCGVHAVEKEVSGARRKGAICCAATCRGSEPVARTVTDDAGEEARGVEIDDVQRWKRVERADGSDERGVEILGGLARERGQCCQ
jgi:hypothetical protein